MALKFIQKLKVKEEQAEISKVGESVKCVDDSKHELQDKVSMYIAENADKLKNGFLTHN